MGIRLMLQYTRVLYVEMFHIIGMDPLLIQDMKHYKYAFSISDNTLSINPTSISLPNRKYALHSIDPSAFRACNASPTIGARYELASKYIKEEMKVSRKLGFPNTSFEMGLVDINQTLVTHTICDKDGLPVLEFTGVYLITRDPKTLKYREFNERERVVWVLTGMFGDKNYELPDQILRNQTVRLWKSKGTLIYMTGTFTHVSTSYFTEERGFPHTVLSLRELKQRLRGISTIEVVNPLERDYPGEYSFKSVKDTSELIL